MASAHSPVEVLSISGRARHVVDPSMVGLAQLLKDRALREGALPETSIVGTMAIRSSRQDDGTVGIGGLPTGQLELDTAR